MNDEKISFLLNISHFQNINKYSQQFNDFMNDKLQNRSIFLHNFDDVTFVLHKFIHRSKCLNKT